jgi:CTP:molybdopterin cytidylyltransferase MocA
MNTRPAGELSRPGGAVAAIILAAGEGTRFGRPKALATLEGKSWLQIAVEGLCDAGFDPIVAVLGADAERVREDSSIAAAVETLMRRKTGLSFVLNPDWRRGRTGSLICGLRAMPPAARGALIHQVDFPYVAASTFRMLAGAFETAQTAQERAGESRGLVFVPTHGGRRGHPILVGCSIWPEIFDLGPDDPLRLVIHRDPSRVREIPVEDPGIHRNVNETDGSEARNGE